MRVPAHTFIGLNNLLMISQPRQKALTQHPPIGFAIVLSGTLSFGHYITCWLNNHNALNGSISAGYNRKLIVPFVVRAGCCAHFLYKQWYSELWLQYSHLIASRRYIAPADPNGISMLSLLPGLQYRWNELQQNVQSRIWVAFF